MAHTYANCSNCSKEFKLSKSIWDRLPTERFCSRDCRTEFRNTTLSQLQTVLLLDIIQTPYETTSYYADINAIPWTTCYGNLQKLAKLNLVRQNKKRWQWLNGNDILIKVKTGNTEPAKFFS